MTHKKTQLIKLTLDRTKGFYTESAHLPACLKQGYPNVISCGFSLQV